MKTLIIEVCEDGVVRVAVGGVAIGLIQEIEFKASTRLHLPSVKITFPSINSMSPDDLAGHFKEILDKYRQAAQECPWVQLVDHADTLPQGMPAVKESK